MESTEEKELKIRILEATIDEFNEKNLKFTMNDIAKRVGISKKTIYQVFSDKESLFIESVNYCFEAIKKSEEQVLQDEELTLVEKVKKIIIVLPERYRNVDLRQLYSLKELYPKIYDRISEQLDNGWEVTFALLNQGIEEGCFKEINVHIFKTMIEATINSFLSTTVLLEEKINYQDALENMLDIMFYGIMK